MRSVFHKKTILLFSLSLLLLTGCTMKKSLPVYQFEYDSSCVLVVDDVRYVENRDLLRLPSQGFENWMFSGKLGEVIGTCGGENAKHVSGYHICRITGDEDADFLYVHPDGFVFGPYYTFFLVREDIDVTLPDAETVSRERMTMKVNKKERKTTDTELVSALVDFYFANTGEEAAHYGVDEGMTALTLTFYHRDYPFFTTELYGCRNIVTGAVYLTCGDGIRREVPEELAKKMGKMK